MQNNKSRQEILTKFQANFVYDFPARAILRRSSARTEKEGIAEGGKQAHFQKEKSFASGRPQ